MKHSLPFIYFTSVCLKFNIPESKQPDMKVYEHSDTEFDEEDFEEIVKESKGTFQVKLRNGELGNH